MIKWTVKTRYLTLMFYANTKNKSILVAADNMLALSKILEGLNTANLNGYNLQTVSSFSLLKKQLDDDSPELIIISFENTPLILNHLSALNNIKSVPVFYFTQEVTSRTHTWNDNWQFFTYNLRKAYAEKSIGNRIEAVLNIINGDEETVENKTNSFATVSNSLSRYVLELDQKNAMLDQLKADLTLLSSKVADPIKNELQTLVNAIKLAKSNHHYWEDFKTHFNNVNPDFLNVLTKEYPNLTTKDIKYCCYLRMNLSNNEITRIMGINQESVRTHKYRLKKKMALSKEQSLKNYLLRFGNRQVEPV